MFHIKLCDRWTGLCNQLFAFTSGILRANSRKTAIVGTFAPELGSNKRIPADKVFDLSKTSKKVGVELIPGADQGRCCFSWYTSHNEQVFNHVLRSIHFRDEFVQLARELLAPHRSETLHVVHFRIEPDAIKHWSRQNKMSAVSFEKALHDKYRTAITKNIPSGSTILALTHDINHPLIREFHSDYRIIAFDTTNLIQSRVGFSGREACAIVDLLIGSECNGVFIGCHNWTLKRGSTFSYTLWKRMHTVKKGVFMDLDDIRQNLQILT